MAYYAWSPIQYGGESTDKDNLAPRAYEEVAVGEEVDAAKLDVSEEDWDALVESGAVRDIPYPEDVPQGKSVSEHLRDLAAANDEATDTTGGTYLLDDAERMAVARATQMEVDERGEVADTEVTPEEAAQAKTPVTEGKDLTLPKAEEETKPAATASSQATASTGTSS